MLLCRPKGDMRIADAPIREGKYQYIYHADGWKYKFDPEEVGKGGGYSGYTASAVSIYRSKKNVFRLVDHNFMGMRKVNLEPWHS